MLPYDDTDPYSIEAYAKGLIGKTFRQVLYESKYFEDAITDSKIDYTNPYQKGKLGTLLEEKYFGYKANSDQEPDFPICGVELKATCFDVLKSGELSAGERLVLTMISYNEPVEPDFFKSHVWEKCRLILLIYYERNKLLQYNIDYTIRFANLISPFEKDMPIILNDYQKIIYKIQHGEAHMLSESDTLYLGACTKGNTSAGSKREQYYYPYIEANKRAFCFKRQYMDYILNTYIVPGNTSYESIVKNPVDLLDYSLEKIVVDRMKQYIGKSDKQLCTEFGREYNNNKAQWTDLTYRMLGIKRNHAEEFEKAGIVVKVIRIEENYETKESVSLPTFDFIEFANEEWEESQVYNYLSETKFFFVMFLKKGEYYYFFRYKFWNMPFFDLNNIVQTGWREIQRNVQSGVKFKIRIIRDGENIVYNSLPKKGNNPIVHIRPHADESAYYIQQENNPPFMKGNIERDANRLPQGDYMTNHSFWLNNHYVIEQLIKQDS